MDKILATGDYPIRVAGEIIEAVNRWKENRKKKGKQVGAEERFQVVFDDNEAHVRALVNAMPSGRRPVPGRSVNLLPLQAGDWLAWELSRLHWEHKRHRGHGGVMPVTIRGTVWHAIRHMPRDWKYLRDGRWLDIVMPHSEAREHFRRAR